MGTVGDDFASYTERLDTLELSTAHIKTIAGSYTAQAFITADLDGNQITAFHPGAMNASHANSVKDAKDVGLAIIAPDGREGMFQHARECHEAGHPLHIRPQPGPAYVHWRRNNGIYRNGRLPDRQRLRSPAH